MGLFSSNSGQRTAAVLTSAATDIGNVSFVKYSELVRGYDGVSLYEVYIGSDKASAVAFLQRRSVSRHYYYIVVDTPEGSFGRDITGLYRE